MACNTGAHTSSGLATTGFRTAKYLVDEWFQNCYARYHQALADRDTSERQRHESKQLAAETEALAVRTQQDSTRRVGERLQDAHSWKSELQQEVDALVTETDLLQAQKQRLERALDATALPYSMATDHLQCRERRQHPDLVRDYVEMELLKVVPLTPEMGWAIMLGRQYRRTAQGSREKSPTAHSRPLHAGNRGSLVTKEDLFPHVLGIPSSQLM